MRLAFFALEPPRPIPAINRTAWTELSRLAGNLNQLAHHANSGEGVVVPLEQVLETMRLVRFLREDLRRDD
jgi:mobilization protein MobC